MRRALTSTGFAHASQASSATRVKDLAQVGISGTFVASPACVPMAQLAILSRANAIVELVGKEIYAMKHATATTMGNTVLNLATVAMMQGVCLLMEPVFVPPDGVG